MGSWQTVVAAVEENVFGFEVAVYRTELMTIAKTTQDLVPAPQHYFFS